MAAQGRVHISTYLQVHDKTRKSGLTNLIFTGAGWLVQCSDCCSEAHSSVCFIRTSWLSRHAARVLSVPATSQHVCLWQHWRKTLYSRSRLYRSRWKLETTSVSYSKHTPAHLPPRCGGDRGEVNKVAGFNRTTLSSVSIDGAGCSLLPKKKKKRRMCGDNVPVSFWNKRQSQIKRWDKVNR